MDISLVVWIPALIFWLWMLYDCIFSNTKEKQSWILVLLFTSIIGALYYYFTEYKKDNHCILYDNKKYKLNQTFDTCRNLEFVSKYDLENSVSRLKTYSSNSQDFFYNGITSFIDKNKVNLNSHYETFYLNLDKGAPVSFEGNFEEINNQLILKGKIKPQPLTSLYPKFLAICLVVNLSTIIFSHKDEADKVFGIAFILIMFPFFFILTFSWIRVGIDHLENFIKKAIVN